LVSNTPHQWVVDSQPRLDTLAFQIDIWSARGEVPRSLAEVSTRQKNPNIRVAPAPALTPQVDTAASPHHLLDKLPEAALLRNVADRKVYNIVHLMYRAKSYEGPAKD
jgi:NTE family protein